MSHSDDIILEHLIPIKEDVAALKAAVLGNGVRPLHQQITDLREECSTAHQRLHDRISSRDPKMDKIKSWKDKMVGAYLCLSGLGTLVLIVLKVRKG